MTTFMRYAHWFAIAFQSIGLLFAAAVHSWGLALWCAGFAAYSCWQLRRKG